MDYLAILKRAFHITRKHRALWLFGILLALFGGGSGGGGSRFSSGGDIGGMSGDGVPFGGNPFAGIDPSVFLMVGLALACLVFVLVIVSIVVRSVARAALIGMVEQVEETDAVTVKDGWRIGWSARAWKIFLINLLVGIPMLAFVLITLAFAASPLTLLFIDQSWLPVAVMLTLLFIIGWALVILLVSVLLNPVLELSWRYAVLYRTGARESLRRTFALIKTDWKRVGVSTLVMIGVGIGIGVVLIVTMILLVIVGGIIGAIPAVLGYLLTKETMVALLAGVPLFLLIVIPLVIGASGITETYRSTAWTLIFKALEKPAAETGAPELLSLSSEATPEDAPPETAGDDAPETPSSPPERDTGDAPLVEMDDDAPDTPPSPDAES